MTLPVASPSARQKLDDLRQQLARGEIGKRAYLKSEGKLATAAPMLSTGLSAIDSHLGGGLLQSALHEIAGMGSDLELAIQSAFFACQILQQHPIQEALWISPTPDLYGHGVLAQGVDPTHLLMAATQGDTDTLWTIEEAARSGVITLIIGEVDQLDLTASRRLQLAAEEKACTILVLRRQRLAGKANQHQDPSAAMTRWIVTPLPSRKPGERPGIGYPRWQVQLWRQRNGPPGCWDIVRRDGAWHHDTETTSPVIEAANDDTTHLSFVQQRSSNG